MTESTLLAIDPVDLLQRPPPLLAVLIQLDNSQGDLLALGNESQADDEDLPGVGADEDRVGEAAMGEQGGGWAEDEADLLSDAAKDFSGIFVNS